MASTQTLEATRQAEQNRLDALKTFGERNELGQFATPAELAVEIAQHVRSFWNQKPKPVRFIDPAVGTGSFFSALVNIFPDSAIERACGIEIDEPFALTAAKLWNSRGLDVQVGDFTRQKPPQTEQARFNLVLTNPPYVRHHHIAADDKLRMKQLVETRFLRPVSGLAGLYVYFLLLAHEWMADEGLGVWLIPSEFMDVNYGRALRAYLSHDVTLLQIHRFAPDDGKFADALVTSAVVIFRKSRPPASHRALFSFGKSISEPSVREKVSLADLRKSSKWTGYPAASTHGVRTKAEAHSLGQLFSIKRGLATGSNDFFIIPRALADSFGVSIKGVRPILPSPRHLRLTVIEQNPDGWPCLAKQQALIDCRLPEAQIKELYPSLWEYLESGKRRDMHCGYLTSHRIPWYSQEDRPAAPFLCTYMGRSRNGANPFRFLRNKSDATATNVYLMLYPKDPLRYLLTQRPELHETVFEALQTIQPGNFLGEGRVYGGGLHKIEPKELAALDATAILKAMPELNLATQMQ